MEGMKKMKMGEHHARFAVNVAAPALTYLALAVFLGGVIASLILGGVFDTTTSWGRPSYNGALAAILIVLSAAPAVVIWAMAWIVRLLAYVADPDLAQEPKKKSGWLEL